MKLLPQLTLAEMQAFEDECFRDWLNRVDAWIEYDVRRELGSVAAWREQFDLGHSIKEAYADLSYARDNRAFCA